MNASEKCPSWPAPGSERAKAISAERVRMREMAAEMYALNVRAEAATCRMLLALAGLVILLRR